MTANPPPEAENDDREEGVILDDWADWFGEDEEFSDKTDSESDEEGEVAAQAEPKYKNHDHKDWNKYKELFKSESLAEKFITMRDLCKAGKPLYNTQKGGIQQDRKSRNANNAGRRENAEMKHKVAALRVFDEFVIDASSESMRKESEKKRFLAVQELLFKKTRGRFFVQRANAVEGWRASVATAPKEAGRSRTKGGGRVCVAADVDKKLLEFVLEKRAPDQQVIVTRKMLLMKAVELSSAQDREKVDDEWLRRFMERHDLVTVKVMNLTRLTQDIKCERAQAFHRFIQQSHQESGPFEIIMNIDEVPGSLCATMSGGALRTVAVRGAPAAQGGMNPNHLKRFGTCVAALVITRSDGGDWVQQTGVLPAIIIKCPNKKPPTIQNPHGLNVTFNECGVINERWCLDHMVSWIRSITGGRKTLLVLDSATSHITPKMKDALKGIGCHLCVVPGGLTPHLQAVDVSFAGKFKMHGLSWYLVQPWIKDATTQAADRSHFVECMRVSHAGATASVRAVELFKKLGYVDPNVSAQPASLLGYKYVPVAYVPQSPHPKAPSKVARQATIGEMFQRAASAKKARTETPRPTPPAPPTQVDDDDDPNEDWMNYGRLQ